MDSEILIPLGGIAMIVAIVWFVNVTRRKAREHRAELIRHLIEKFSTGEAFAAAMQGPEGARLAETLSLEPTKPQAGWVGLFIPGAVLACVGIAFLVLAGFINGNFTIPGVLCCAVGAGLLLSAYVARRVERRETDWASEADGRAALDPDDSQRSGTELP
jgi:hypothetical protein